MLCQGVIQEQNRERACWLPAQSNSQFQLCRRCHFHKITQILDSLTREYAQGELHPPYEMLLNDTAFLNELLHPAREQALLNCLSVLFQTNKIQFQHAVTKLKKQTVFTIFLTKRIESHMPSPKCRMYRRCMEDSSLYNARTICWNCWPCVAWSLQKGTPRLLQLFDLSFPFYHKRLTYDVFTQIGAPLVVDMFVSLYLLQKKDQLRLWIDYLFHVLPLDGFIKCITLFLVHPVIRDTEKIVLPLPLQDTVVLQDFKRKIKISIKENMNRIKEELIEKTWHPRRLFPWCLDVEEWKDFGVSNDNCHGVYEDFLLNAR